MRTAAAEGAARHPLTAVQQGRRRRIIDAALELAAEGGFEAVQMREVAARADVALGTLYRYFSSKEHLLVAAMAEQVAGMRQRLAERPALGEDAAHRVVDVLRRANRALQRQPRVTGAMVRALISSDGAIDGLLAPIGEDMTAIVVGAIGSETPGAEDHDVAEVIQHVWLAALVWWAAGRAPASRIEETVAKAAHLLMQEAR